MYDPKEILTEYGYKKYLMYLFMLEEALSFLSAHVDDLHIGANEDDKSLDTINDMLALLRSKKLETGDGEVDE